MKIYKATLLELSLKPLTKAAVIAATEHLYHGTTIDTMEKADKLMNEFIQVADMPGYYVDPNEYEFKNEDYNEDQSIVPETPDEIIDDGDYEVPNFVSDLGHPDDVARYRDTLARVKERLGLQ
jgi:isopenicillin N synthase-like dioxygenase